MNKEDFLREEYISLREEIKETKSRLFRLAALGIIGMPAAYSTAELYSIDVLILSLPLLMCTVILLYLSESRALMRCGTYIKNKIESGVDGNGDRTIGWESWLSRNDESGPDRRAVDKIIAVFFYLLFTFYYIASSQLAIDLANNKYGILGAASALGFYIAIGILFLWYLFTNYKVSTST